MGFKVGDTVRIVTSNAYSDCKGTVVTRAYGSIWDYNVSFSEDKRKFGFRESELELVPGTPDVGDTVRVSLGGVVERYEERDGGVVMVGVSDGGAIWVKAKYAEVISKAVKEPVVLGLGSLLVDGATAPAGSIARDLTDFRAAIAVSNGVNWVWVDDATTATFPLLLGYKVTYVPPAVVVSA